MEYIFWGLGFKTLLYQSRIGSGISAGSGTHDSSSERDQGAALAPGGHAVQWAQAHHLRGQAWEIRIKLIDIK